MVTCHLRGPGGKRFLEYQCPKNRRGGSAVNILKAGQEWTNTTSNFEVVGKNKTVSTTVGDNFLAPGEFGS